MIDLQYFDNFICQSRLGRVGSLSYQRRRKQKMGENGVTAIGNLLGEEDDIGGASNNALATRNAKQINTRGDEEGAGDGSGSSIQTLIEVRLREDPYVLMLDSLKMQNLGDLQKMTALNDLMKIDISKNYLDNIDALNELLKLKVITANNNYIRDVSLQLPKLQELDLGNNYIDKVPILSQMPQLKILLLNANKIRELKLQCKHSNYANIMKMVFRNNSIRFTNMEVINFVKKLKEFKSLRVLNMENNPFEKDAQVNAKIIRNLPQSLEMYNNQKKVYVQSTITYAPDQDAAGEGEEHDEEEVKQQVTQRMPTLENLLYNLEAANSHPNKALTFLKQLYVDADKIKMVQATQSQSVFVQSFTRSKDTHTIRENIETFMQHAQLLVDNHFELRNIILSILSKLTVIRSHDFGVKCFYTLRDLMVAGKELEIQVMEQLNQNVIRELGDMPSQDIPVSILIGLKDLVEKQQSHQTNLMSQLFEKFFPKWLQEIKQKFSRQKGGPNREEESEQTDAVFGLLTASLRGDEMSVAKMYQKNLHDMVAEIFIKTSPQKSRYLHLLESMNEIAKMHSQAASDYIEKFVHREILQEIKLTFYKYKKAQELVPEDNKDNVAAIAKMYRVFSAQIDLIASLLNAEPRLAQYILQESLVSELLQVLTHSNTDPILLTSLCYLAQKVLQSDHVRTNPVELQDKINRMQSCEALIPYLGLQKYQDLIKNTQKYNSEDQVLQIDNSGDALVYQNDPIIHVTFIQIIKLIEFFCREYALMVKQERMSTTPFNSEQLKIMKLLGGVCSRLNAADREDALFKVLVVPNDDVRLAVVNCLYWVPIDEIDGSEIDKLLKMMSPQNVGAGKTELVLAIVYNILSNLISDTQKKSSETTTLFKTKFSFTAISMAINIMIKNQERVVEEVDEEEEKYTLALSILNFLKHVSKEVKTKDQLKNKGEVLKRILFAEQCHTRDFSFVVTPIEVEVTQMGMDFESLRGAIQQGYMQIEPYNYISFRILHQMANLLQQEWPKGTYDPHVSADNEDLGLIEAYRANLDRKKQYENQFWELSSQSRLNDDEFDEQKKEIKMHHKVFTKKNGVKGILHFLTAQQNHIENWLRLNSDPAINHAGSKEKHQIFGRGLKYKLLKKFRKARKKWEDEEKQEIMLGGMNNTKGKKSKTNAAAQSKGATQEQTEKAKEQREQQMRAMMRNEELGSGYLISDTDLYLAQRKPTMISALLKQREFARMGIQNPELRSLCISAFLRCLYASIDAAPNGEYYEMAIENLKSDKVFNQITQLCASTGWLSANIGSKYLQVMRYIIRVGPTKRLEEQDNLLKYEILSVVVKRVLGLLKAKIKNVNNNMVLTMSDKNLLTHLAVISQQMVKQCSLFHWRQKKDNYKKIEGADHRELRYQLIDKLMSQLFSLDEVQLLVDVIFQEMDNASKRIHGAAKQEDPEMERKMKDLGNRILESLGKFLTEYLAYCNTNKYHVIQYLTSIMVHDTSKKMRTPFLEGILEGANQIQVSRLYIEKMIKADSAELGTDDDDEGPNPNKKKVRTFSLCFKRKVEIDQWLKKYAKKVNEAEVQAKQQEQLAVERDCSLGERILYSQPMPVHVNILGAKSASNDYKVLLVLITNQGVYILDDYEQSWMQNPEDRANLTIPENRKIDRFSFEEVKNVFFATVPQQRFTIQVCRQVDDSGSGFMGAMGSLFGGGQKATPTPTPTPTPDHGDTTRGGDDEETKSESSARQATTQGRRGREVATRTEELHVTIVLPNSGDYSQLRLIFEEALLQFQSSENEEKVHDDNLLNYTILMDEIFQMVANQGKKKASLKEGNCPFCKKLRIVDKIEQRKCKCEYHIAYAYKLDVEATLKLVTKSRQRGGPCRLLSSEKDEHWDNLQDGINQRSLNKDYRDYKDAVFGILLISHVAIYFFKENPSRWENHSQRRDTELLNRFKHLREVDEGDEEGLLGLVNISESDIIELKSLEGLSVINGRVPTLEVLYKDKAERKQVKKWFSLLSDFNVQETLNQIRAMKRAAFLKSQEMDDD